MRNTIVPYSRITWIPFFITVANFQKPSKFGNGWLEDNNIGQQNINKLIAADTKWWNKHHFLSICSKTLQHTPLRPRHIPLSLGSMLCLWMRVHSLIWVKCPANSSRANLVRIAIKNKERGWGWVQELCDWTNLLQDLQETWPLDLGVSDAVFFSAFFEGWGVALWPLAFLPSTRKVEI